MALIEKNGTIKIGYDPIDRDHDEFIDLLNQLDSVGDAEFRELFQQLFEHTERHFERENQLMEQFSFPAAAEHKGEHQRVLGEFKQFKKRIDKGLLAFGRAFIKERLPQWFALHASTMDGALAAHIKMQNDS